MVEAGRRYRVLETLGRGGFGVVYRAEVLGEDGFTKHVAIKLLEPKTGEIPDDMVQRFRDEARVLGLISHPAVVKVERLARLKNGWAMIMEYVHGVNASSLVGSPIPSRAVFELAADVSGALHAAWALPSQVTGEPLHLVHRDIKPANIRITTHGEVKILDFGVARAEFDEREAETSELRYGSRRYMSPERSDGIEGPECDVYALGLVTAELLSGARFTEPPKHPARHVEFVDGILEKIRQHGGLGDRAEEAFLLVKDMLAYEPAQRPSSRDVQRRAWELSEKLPGQTLREWSEAEIDDLVAVLRASRDSDPATDTILVEGGTTAPAATSNRALGVLSVAALGVAIALGVVALISVATSLGVVAATASRESADKTERAPIVPVQAAPPAPPVAPAPAPTPASEPVATDAAPKPKTQKPAPAESQGPAPAHVSLAGDATSVVLNGQIGRFSLSPSATSVPAGSYDVLAGFGADPAVAGRVTLTSGETATVACNGMLMRCSKR